MKKAAKEFEESLGSEDVTRIAEADVAYHDIICRSTDNQRLMQLLNNFREQMYRYRVEYLKKKECYPQLLREHQAIIEAIEKSNKETEGFLHYVLNYGNLYKLPVFGTYFGYQNETGGDTYEIFKSEQEQNHCIAVHAGSGNSDRTDL